VKYKPVDISERYRLLRSNASVRLVRDFFDMVKLGKDRKERQVE
jgi:hypothetical protein